MKNIDLSYASTSKFKGPEQDSNQWHVALPAVLLSTGAILLVLLLAGYVAWRRRRSFGLSTERDSLAPSILVYPSYQGDSAPQLISKQIDFQLPQLRRSESLDDFDGGSTACLDDVSRQHELNAGPGTRDCNSSPRHAAAATQDDERRGSTHSFGTPTKQHRSNSFSGGYGRCYGGLDPSLYKNPSELEEELHYPEGHLGRVWFYLRYEPSSEKLLITLLKIKNLPSRTVGTANGCDPLVRLQLIPNERRVQQSRQKKKTCNPFFDETFVFQISEKELADHSLRMIVLDSGRNKKTNAIGCITFPLRHLACDHPTDQLELLKMDLEKDTNGSVSESGELLLSLFYNENLHRLTVSVIAARNLKLWDNGKDESYVRLILNQHWHTVKVKRTSTVRGGGREPKYSQGFNFRVPASNIDVTSLSFKVYQPHQGIGKDKLIGKCVLGSYMFARGKALTHWTSAFANPMEQIQNWQALTQCDE